MSHIREIDFDRADQQITDLTALELAAKDCGMEFHKGQTSFRSWKTEHGRLAGDYPLPEGRTEDEVGTCLHAISLPDGEKSETGTDSYEVGVVESRKHEGAFSLMFDFWGGAIQNKIGEKGSKLVQHYRKHALRMAHELQGDTVSTHMDADGNIVVEADTTLRMGT